MREERKKDKLESGEGKKKSIKGDVLEEEKRERERGKIKEKK